MKNKTKKIIRITFAILLVVIVQTIGITYAKYIATEKGTGQAEIAQWAFEIVKDGEQTKTINLADTVADGSVPSGKLAPGSYGSILLELDATNSDVDVDYTLEFANEKNKPENLEFVSNGVTYDSITEIVSSGTIKSDAQVKTKQISILWRWPYETGTTDEEKVTNNIVDTEYANTNTEYTFDIIATGTQSK